MLIFLTTYSKAYTVAKECVLSDASPTGVLTVNAFGKWNELCLLFCRITTHIIISNVLRNPLVSKQFNKGLPNLTDQKLFLCDIC